MEWPVSDERGMRRDYGVHLDGGDHGGVIAESFWGERGCACFLHEAWSGATFGGGCDLRPAVLTVPLPFFYKRHGRLYRLPHDFERAFVVFLQKARSVVPSAS